MKCLNPSLKLEALYKLIKDKAFDPTRATSDKDFVAINQALKDQEKKLNDQYKTQNINYIQWMKKANDDINSKSTTKTQTKISRKVILVDTFQTFLKGVITDVAQLVGHLHRAHMQYKGFKEVRQSAQINPDEVVLQIDWAENARVRQANEESSAYYFEDHISIHAKYSWSAEGKQSWAAISDHTDHKAPATVVSFKSILNEFVNISRKNKITIVSDSPTKQYRNKTIFYYMKRFVQSFKDVEFKWIFLEAGHGKGIPDGIGATVKKAIKNIVAKNPSVPVYKAQDLFEKGITEDLPAISLSTYSEEAVVEVAKRFLDEIKRIDGTMRIHEIQAVYNASFGEATLMAKNTCYDHQYKVDVPVTNFSESKRTLLCQSLGLPSLDELQKASVTDVQQTTFDSTDDAQLSHTGVQVSQPTLEEYRDAIECFTSETISRSQNELKILDISAIIPNQTWVKVLYEEEVFIGQVQKVGINEESNENECSVRCLKKPYLVGFNGNEFENDNHTIFYDKVYELINYPKLQQFGRQYLWVYDLDLKVLFDKLSCIYLV